MNDPAPASPLAESLGPTSLDRVTVVVPIAPGEEAWRRLIPDFRPLGRSSEILLVGTEVAPADLSSFIVASQVVCPVRWLASAAGRARQQNHGAANATGRFLWFVHADSQIEPHGLQALASALSEAPHALHFFELRFAADGPELTKLNAWGANVRSRLLGLPFGDQGFCLSRETFDRLGGFPADAAYGEDHLLVWRAHQSAVPVRPVGACLVTSARKYADHGWLATTATHIRRTVWQGLQELATILVRYRRPTSSQ